MDNNANQPLQSLVQLGELPEIVKHFAGAPMLNALIQNGRELDRLAANSSSMDQNKNDKVLSLLRGNITRLEQICNAWLNTGHYSEVPDRHRLLYAFICAHRAKLEHLCGDYQASLRACDEGLLKGNDLEDGSLARFASLLCTKFLPIPPEIVGQQEKFESKSFPAPPPLPNSIEISALCLPSLETFCAQFFSPQKPLVIRGMVNEWPAFNKWSLEVSQAILAAAKNNKDATMAFQQQQNAQNEASTEENENNFLHRLHKNAQLLSCKVDQNIENDAEKSPPPFSSPKQKIIEENGKNNEKQGGGGEIILEIPAKLIAKLNALFGDKKADEEQLEDGLTNSIEVPLPCWLGELLYRASKRMPIPSKDPLEEGKILFPEDVDSDNSQSQQQQKGMRKKKGGDRPNPSSNSNLCSLYQAFPNIPTKTIKQCAKENNYDYNQTAEDLLNNVVADQLSQLEIEESRNNAIGGTNGNYPYSGAVASYIVPSHCPRVISELEQQREMGASPPTNLMPENWFQRVEEIDEIAKDLARIEEERKFYVAKANSISSRDGAIRAHFASKARSLVEEKRWLESQCDRIRAWNSHNDVYLDLHDMGAERALELIKYKIDLCREKHPNYRKLHAITGYGKTTGQPSIIRARLIQYLKQKGIDYAISPTNFGVLDIHLTGIHQRLTDE